MPKSILITGCSSGIGLCVAQGLHERGHQVFATARRREDVERLRSTGLTSLVLDLDDSASIRDALDEVLRQTSGTLDALFNNGAYGQPGAVEDLRREVLRAQFETNVFGPLELTNRVLPVMRRQGHGRIIQNSSVLGFVALPYRGAYNASKFALEGLTDTLRLELAGTGIHLSLIEPGPIISRFRENAYAAYQRNIDKTGSAHRDRYEAMENRLTTQGSVAPFTLPPEAVLKCVVHALESPHPRIRYRVTLPTHAFAILQRLLPDKGMDWLLRRIAAAESRR
ncbi:MAG: SDR family oxidoreductase [Gammaproteobacteria bacterium]|nr:SDR family oxidoreductase [Gammaproteobacteria bacterium]MCP5423999.1 SDR family oxidoreductase [Gammaproteobacteria bacterium]